MRNVLIGLLIQKGAPQRPLLFAWEKRLDNFSREDIVVSQTLFE